MTKLAPILIACALAHAAFAAATNSLERLRCNNPGLIVVFGGEDERFYWIANPRAALAK